MKILSIIIFLLIGITSVHAQAQPMSKDWMNREIKQVRPGIYKVEMTLSPYTSYKGIIIKKRNKFVRDGVWIGYRYGKPVQMIKYDMGQRVWIKTGGIKYTQQEIEIQKLKNRLSYLEKQLTKLDQ